MDAPGLEANSPILSIWKQPCTFPLLDHHEVHLWRFGLELPFRIETLLETILDDDERRRADRLRGNGLRRKFIAGRGMLKTLLGLYLDLAPSEIRFTYGIHGKPGLANASSGISFNLAHSGEIALFAIGRGGSMGVDVETLRPLENAEKIIRRFFSTAEQMAFDALPLAERFKAFYRGWTRKEAFLKATGTGLATRLDSFDVSLTADEPARILRIDETLNGSGDWKIYDVDPGSGYAGALVVSASIARGKLKDPLIHLWDGDNLSFPL